MRKYELRTLRRRLIATIEAESVVDAINAASAQGFDLKDLCLRGVVVSGTILKGITGLRFIDCDIRRLELKAGEQFLKLKIEGGTLDLFDCSNAKVWNSEIKGVGGNVRLGALGADLSQSKFHDFKYAYMNFMDADLDSCMFTKILPGVSPSGEKPRVNMAKANLTYAKLTECEFPNWILNTTNLSYAHLFKVKGHVNYLRNANLSFSNWMHSDLVLDLAEADLVDFRNSWWGHCTIRSCRRTNYSRFDNCNFESAVFEKCRIGRASFSRSSLAHAQFADRTFETLNLDRVDISGTHLGAFDRMGEFRFLKGNNDLIPVMYVPGYWDVSAIKCAGKTMIQIGCQTHTYEHWETFEDETIEEMDDNAVKFWKTWKEPILALARSIKEFEDLPA